jgi:hypothetical protein
MIYAGGVISNHRSNDLDMRPILRATLTLTTPLYACTYRNTDP